MTRPFCRLLLLLLLAASLAAQRKPGPSAIESGLRAWQRAEGPDRKEILGRFARWGEPFRSYLRKRRKDDPIQGQIPGLLKDLDHLEGLDLLQLKVKRKPSPTTPWVFSSRQVVVVRLKTSWAALRIGDGHDPSARTLSVQASFVKDKLQLFRERGPQVRILTAKGRLAPHASVMASAFPDCFYDLDLGECTVVIRSVGADGFRIIYGPDFSVAFTSQMKFRRLKPSAKGLHYESKPSTIYPAVERRVQKYLFRILDGVEPLPTFETPDEARYAFAEPVQVEIREEPGGKPVLWIVISHSEGPPYTSLSDELLLRFAYRAARIPAKDIVVSFGDQEPREANRFWQKGRFRPAKGALLKRIRRLFPDDG